MAASAAAASAAADATVAAPKESIADVAERARTKFMTGPLQNISLQLLGMAPWNRARLGVSIFHVFDIKVSIDEDGLSRQRYRDVCVIRVPDSELDFSTSSIGRSWRLAPIWHRSQIRCGTHVLLSILARLDSFALFSVSSAVFYASSACRGSNLLPPYTDNTWVQEPLRHRAEAVCLWQGEAQGHG